MAEAHENQQPEMATAPDGDGKREAPHWLVENIAEASKNARRIYFLYLGFIGYCALTVVSTSDRQIVLNETVSLPILKIDVSLNGFFILAPLIAIFVFSYLQLYLNIRKDLITRLKTKFPPAGRERLYPWMLLALDYPTKGLIGALQSAIVKFSMWWSLPLVLALISAWYIKKHDPIMTYTIGVSPILGTVVVLCFWFHYEDIKLRMRQLPRLMLRNPGKTALLSVVVMFEVVILILIIPMAINGFPQIASKGAVERAALEIIAEVTNRTDMGVLRYRVTRYLKSWLCVDLNYQKLVQEPETDYVGLFWANLSNARLEGANLARVVLKRADLEDAHLQNATMVSANLIEARLQRANLQGADLRQANLRGAKLGRAVLKGANLKGAQIQEADLGGAELRGAVLEGADLEGANLIRADVREANLRNANLQRTSFERANLQATDFKGADLRGAKLGGAELQNAYFHGAKGLTRDQLLKARNWILAFYSADHLEALGLPPGHIIRSSRKNFSEYDLEGLNLSHNDLGGYTLVDASLERANLAWANLSKANLQGASLRKANLRWANLQGANLREADLEGADLRGTKFLTVEGLSRVKTLYRAKLDKKLREEIEGDYPHLLEMPKPHR
jgi:uncharacterized protein YjbI with pentapeptide repeats